MSLEATCLYYHPFPLLSTPFFIFFWLSTFCSVFPRRGSVFCGLCGSFAPGQLQGGLPGLLFGLIGLAQPGNGLIQPRLVVAKALDPALGLGGLFQAPGFGPEDDPQLLALLLLYGFDAVAHPLVFAAIGIAAVEKVKQWQTGKHGWFLSGRGLPPALI